MVKNIKNIKTNTEEYIVKGRSPAIFLNLEYYSDKIDKLAVTSCGNWRTWCVRSLEFYVKEYQNLEEGMETKNVFRPERWSYD